MDQSSDYLKPDSHYFEQQIQSQNYAPDVVQYITSKYKSVMSTLDAQSIKKEEDEYFAPDDILGKTWYRLQKEVTKMKDLKPPVLPPLAQDAFDFSYKALAGLWLEKRSYNEEKENHPQKENPLSKTESDNISRNLFPYRDAVRGYIAGGYSDRYAVGYLMREIDLKGASAFLMTKDIDGDVQFEKSLAEYRIGSKLAFGKWQTLSTVG